MSDRVRRALERRAQAGDPGALAAWARSTERAGGVGDADVFAAQLERLVEEVRRSAPELGGVEEGVRGVVEGLVREGQDGRASFPEADEGVARWVVYGARVGERVVVGVGASRVAYAGPHRVWAALADPWRGRAERVRGWLAAHPQRPWSGPSPLSGLPCGVLEVSAAGARAWAESVETCLGRER